MIKSIWKHEINIVDFQYVDMPLGAKILTVQLQEKGICLWALVDPEAPCVLRRIELYGTGHSIEFGQLVERKYIGTVQTYSGAYVWHAFEVV